MIVVMLDCKFIRQKKYPGLLVNIAFFFFHFCKNQIFYSGFGRTSIGDN